MCSWAAGFFCCSISGRNILLSLSTTTGGDTASHYYTAYYTAHHLLPHGRVLGWMPGNWAGFPFSSFISPCPFWPWGPGLGHAPSGGLQAGERGGGLHAPPLRLLRAPPGQAGLSRPGPGRGIHPALFVQRNPVHVGGQHPQPVGRRDGLLHRPGPIGSVSGSVAPGHRSKTARGAKRHNPGRGGALSRMHPALRRFGRRALAFPADARRQGP